MAVKFFLHTCSECSLRYRIVLPVEREVLFRSRCPDCRAKFFFDNRDGGLKLPRSKLLSRPIRQYYLQEGVDYESPTTPENEPETIPAELVHRHTDGESASVPVESETPAADETPISMAEPEVPAGELPRETPIDETPAPPQEPSVPVESPVPEEPSATEEPVANEQTPIDPEPAIAIEPAAKEPAPIEPEPTVTEEPAAHEEPVVNEEPPIEPVAEAPPAENQQPLAPVEGEPLANEEPSAQKEPSADEEPSAQKEPTASEEPSAQKEPTARKEPEPQASDNEKEEEVKVAAAIKDVEEPAEPHVPLGERLREKFNALRALGREKWQAARAAMGAKAREHVPEHVREKIAFAGGKLRGSRRYFLLAFAVLALYLGASLRFPMLLFFKDPKIIEARMRPVQPNRVVDRDGRLIAELFSRKTSNIKIVDFPKSLRRTLIFVEDDSFMNHGGIRPLAVVRAAISNIMARSYVEGGSTITQQLARILMRNREKAFLRKFKEAILAMHLERRFPKDAILNAYINHVYLGHGAYGLESAAEFYLNKDLKELNFTEQLMLVTLLPAPETLSPLRNPARLEQRMDLLYGRMIREAYAAAPADVYRRQKNELFESFNRSPNENVFSRRVNHAPYVAEYIRIALTRILGRERQYNENITIHTTLDGELQKAAVRETVAYINNISHRYPPRRIDPNAKADKSGQKKRKPRKKKKPSLKERLNEEYRRAEFAAFMSGLPRPRGKKAPRLQAAALGVQPETGEILFMQGGSGFSAGNQLNRALDMRRQTGSAIKPIVFSAGVEHGVITPATILLDEPTALDGENPTEPGLWRPRNYHDDYRGEVTARETLRYSLNVPSVLVGKRIGMNRLSAHFRRFFFPDEASFKKRFRRDLTISIGSLEMSPLEMALAYSAFGNNGVIRRPYLIRRITGADGKILYENGKKDEFNTRLPMERRVLPGDVAMVMASMLRDSGRRGGVQRGGFKGKQLLGKTGTTNEHRDAWFIGVVPGLSAAVWVGYDNPSNSMGKGTGAGVAGPLWGRIIKHARAGDSFQFEPRAIFRKVCVKSGLPAARTCPRRRMEIFAGSVRPPHRCRLHSGPRLKKQSPARKTGGEKPGGDSRPSPGTPPSGDLSQ